MSYDVRSNFLSNLDEDTRNRYIKMKVSQGIDIAEPKESQILTMGGPPSRYFPTYEASKSLERIYSSIEVGDINLVKTLVEDQDYNPTSDYLSKALAAAMKSRQFPIIQYLLDKGAGIDRQVLAAASQAKSLQVFELMAKAGWDVNAPMFGGHIMLSSVIQDEALVEWLLRRGADPNLGPPKTGAYAEALPTTGSGGCLYEAAACSSPTVINLLLASGAKLENSTPLHAAVRRGGDSIPMLRHLLSLGVDVNSLASPYDQFSVGTPLESVIRHGVRGDSVPIVRFLLENGADPHPEGRPGIDAFSEPIRSEMQKLYEQSQSKKSGSHDELQSSASSATLVES